ncbi:MAG: SDR family NAD(P)-dependent oxidoreductase [Caulobacterales bacterium]|nr:SDR family NAD(P)-dependent oxidoreductase [Caulobacterales bacterium]
MSVNSDLSAGANDRVVLVTGAGKGLGRSFALAAARSGARVVVNNRVREGAADSAASVVEEIRAAGGEAVADRHDVAGDGAGEAMVAAAMEAYGRLDAVILNAGVAGEAAKLADASPQDYRDVLEINFFAAVALAAAARLHLEASGAGRLVFVASSAGLYGVRGRAPYAASKAALTAFALSLAAELRRAQVGVNVLVPYALTRMTKDVATAAAGGPSLSPEQVAPIAAALASPAYQGTGEIWVAGAGYLRRARMMESLGGPTPQSSVNGAWLAAEAGALSDMRGAASFTGAEAAFQDLLARAADAGEAPR